MYRVIIRGSGIIGVFAWYWPLLRWSVCLQQNCNPFSLYFIHVWAVMMVSHTTSELFYHQQVPFIATMHVYHRARRWLTAQGIKVNCADSLLSSWFSMMQLNIDMVVKSDIIAAGKPHKIVHVKLQVPQKTSLLKAFILKGISHLLYNACTMIADSTTMHHVAVKSTSADLCCIVCPRGCSF